jgi:hypothetical protein
MRHYVAEARRTCGSSLGAVGAGSRVITADTLMVDRVDVPATTIQDTWTAAVRAGAFQLPGHVERAAASSTDFTYVVEMRRGNDYRASEIEHLERPETEADRQVQEVYAAVSRVLPRDQLLKPELWPRRPEGVAQSPPSVPFVRTGLPPIGDARPLPRGGTPPLTR